MADFKKQKCPINKTNARKLLNTKKPITVGMCWTVYNWLENYARSNSAPLSFCGADAFNSIVSVLGEDCELLRSLRTNVAA